MQSIIRKSTRKKDILLITAALADAGSYSKTDFTVWQVRISLTRGRVSLILEINCCKLTVLASHLTPSLVVVKVHQVPSPLELLVSLLLRGVHKLTGKLDSEPQIVTVQE